jgi:prepilin-type N-terminal cleavage/methylation domain-containing protein/prepilin-type processing-associated H-X9-DG protein
MKRTKGFTLIELLVVIAIIAILAAILFPVFAQAREKARQITCVSNEKQMGLAMLQYVQDYDETFPVGQYYDANGNPLDWQNAIYPYVKNGTSTGTASGSTAYNGLGGIWSCPSFPSNQIDEYGVNADICIPGDYLSAATSPLGYAVPVTNLAAIDSPADKIIIAEKGQGATGGEPFVAVDEYVWTYSGFGQDDGDTRDLQWDYDQPINPSGSNGYPGPATMPRYRHAVHCNVLYSDGHVKAIAKGQMSGGTKWYNEWYVDGHSISGPAY